MITGIPWILSWSMNALPISNENVPTGFSGLPTQGNRADWIKFDKTLENETKEFFNTYSSWVVENGGESLKRTLPFLNNDSPFANIYMCPEELDYTEFRPNPPNWHRFETFIRSSNEVFEIPKKLKDLPGRLVYFSMGSIGCAEIGLMKRLVEILSKSPHRFIVSKG